MNSLSSPAIQNGLANQRDLTWSSSEKAIARKAFDAALKRELHEVIQEAQQMASRIRQSSDLWDVEHYLTQRRRDRIARTTTGTQLSLVFGKLLRESRLGEEELCGLWEDKLEIDPLLRQILGQDRRSMNLGFECNCLFSSVILLATRHLVHAVPEWRSFASLKAAQM